MIKKKYNSLSAYLNVFSNPLDIWKFRNLRMNKIKNQSRVYFSLKEGGNHPLICRPNSSDVGVLWQTFYHKYHLPPYPLDKDSIIVDLGANVGYTTTHFAFLYPTSCIYGVEMNYENFLIAKENTAFLGDRCKMMHAAVWNKDGEIFYCGRESNQFSVFNNPVENTKVQEKAPAKTIDTIFEEFGITSVDYLKMDIEGAEKVVLEKPAKWMNLVKSMKIEIHEPANIDDCMKVLNQCGFQCNKNNEDPPCIIAKRIIQ